MARKKQRHLPKWRIWKLWRPGSRARTGPQADAPRDPRADFAAETKRTTISGKAFQRAVGGGSYENRGGNLPNPDQDQVRAISETTGLERLGAGRDFQPSEIEAECREGAAASVGFRARLVGGVPGWPVARPPSKACRRTGARNPGKTPADVHGQSRTEALCPDGFLHHCVWPVLFVLQPGDAIGKIAFQVSAAYLTGRILMTLLRMVLAPSTPALRLVPLRLPSRPAPCSIGPDDW